MQSQGKPAQVIILRDRSQDWEEPRPLRPQRSRSLLAVACQLLTHDLEGARKAYPFQFCTNLLGSGPRWEQKRAVPSASKSHPGHLGAGNRRQNALNLHLRLCRGRCQRRRHLLHILNTSLQDSRPCTFTHGADQKRFFFLRD